MMIGYYVFILITFQVWIPTATEILYVSPDNSTNGSCPSHRCTTLKVTQSIFVG